MLTSQISVSDYTVTYKKKKTGFYFVSMIWLVTCAANTIKTYKKTGISDYSDLFWPFLFVVYILIMLDFILSKAIFVITDGQLTISKRNLFHRSTQIFNIDEMEQITVQQVETKPFLKRTAATNDQTLTFVYREKQVALGTDLQKFNGEELLRIINSVR